MKNQLHDLPLSVLYEGDLRINNLIEELGVCRGIDFNFWLASHLGHYLSILTGDGQNEVRGQLIVSRIGLIDLRSNFGFLALHCGQSSQRPDGAGIFRIQLEGLLVVRDRQLFLLMHHVSFPQAVIRIESLRISLNIEFEDFNRLVIFPQL